MLLDFPSSPTEGQIYAPPDGPRYQWNSPVWDVVGASGAGSSDDLWWETRAAFVASVAGGMPISKGKAYTAGGYNYIGSPGAVDIPDLIGLLPFGDVYAGHFGGVPDCVRNANDVYTTGTDSLVAINRLIAYMTAHKVDGRLGPGAFYSSAQITNNSGYVLRGSGRTATTLHVKVSVGNASATLIPPGATGSGFADMTICIETTVPKVAGNGQYHAVVGVGGEYFFPTTPPWPIEGFTLENLRLYRANSGVSSGSGLYMIGYITGGRVHNITGRGTKDLHGGMGVAHWAGLRAAEGSPTTETYHVGNVTFSAFDGEGALFALQWSSTYNMHLIGALLCKGCTSAFNWLPGDEGNVYAVAAQARLVGRGNHIDNICIDGIVHDPANAIVTGFSNGTSHVAKFPAPDAAVGLQTQYWQEIEIGSISGRTSASQDRGLVDFGKWYGDLRIGSIDVGDSVTRSVVNLGQCNGVRIGQIVGKATYASTSGIVQIIQSSNVRIGGGHIEHAQVGTTNIRGVFCSGAVPLALTLSADAAAGAVEIFVTGTVTADITVDTPVLVNGHLVRVTAYVESACTRIPVTPLPAAVTSGQAVSVSQSSNNVDVTLDVTGPWTAVEFEFCQGRYSGRISRSGLIGLRADLSSRMVYENVVFRGNGRGRIADGALLTREMLIAGTARGRMSNCTFGLDCEYAERNIEVSAAGSAEVLDNRLVVVDSEFAGQGIGGYVGGTGNTTDYKLVNCYTTAGVVVS